MNKNVFITTEIYTENEQKILIQPEPGFSGDIELYVSEANPIKGEANQEYGPLYLSSEEVEVFCKKMQEMLDYIKFKNQ